MDLDRLYKLKSPKTVGGLCIVGLGILGLLRTHGFDISVWGLFWPTVLILIGIGLLLEPKELRFPVNGLLCIFIGGSFLIRNLGIYPITAELIFYTTAIILGVRIVTVASASSKNSITNTNYIKVHAYFRSGKFVFPHRPLKGGVVSAILFSGRVLDLRNAVLDSGKHPVIINVFVSGGTLVFKIPEDWNIVVRVVNIMSIVSNKTEPRYETEDSLMQAVENRTLIIKGYNITGLIKVTN